MPDGSMRVDDRMIRSDSEWIAGQNLEEYAGQWIAVFDRAIVARDRSLKKVLRMVERLGLSTVPLYIRIPEGVMINCA